MGLGAWDDKPCRHFELDVRAVPLDSRQAFVLTRIDGVATIAELCAMSGLGEADTLSALEHLLAHGLIHLEPGVGPRRLIGETPAEPEAALDARATTCLPEQVSRAEVELVPASLPDFNGVDAADALWLSRRGPLFRVTGKPTIEPGLGRYGRFKVDKRALLERCDLTVEQRREILFLSQLADSLDHFEFFRIEPTDDRRELKKAYFAFSKLFHPDVHFRKDTASFGPSIEQIFKRGTDIHEQLANDDELRVRYTRAVVARNAAYRQLLDGLRKAESERRKVAEAPPPPPVTPDRREALKARLEQNTIKRREGQANPVQERITRAEKYYSEGMTQYENEAYVQAAASLKLATTYDPNNATYQEAYKRVHLKAQEVKADQHWKRGYMQESVGRTKEALVEYLQAIDAHPKAEYCVHLAELFLSRDENLHRAAELAQIACDAEPNNLDYKILLGRIFQQVGLVKKAIGVFERVQQLDARNEIAKKSLKMLRRM